MSVKKYNEAQGAKMHIYATHVKTKRRLLVASFFDWTKAVEYCEHQSRHCWSHVRFSTNPNERVNQ